MREDEYIAVRDLALLRAAIRLLGSVGPSDDVRGAARFVQAEIDRLEKEVERAMDSNTERESRRRVILTESSKITRPLTAISFTVPLRVLSELRDSGAKHTKGRVL